ncbi:MAG: DUF429 domain-containing protein [Candidatus Micrarchaeia archaeon]
MKIAGIDLAGSERGNTGFCIIAGKRMRTKVLHTDAEIMEELRKGKPEIVGMDAPLSLPPGRKKISDRNGAHFRKCDLELREMGIRFFPITIGPMRMLTERGMALARRIRRGGVRVEETYPGAAYDILGVPRKDKAKIRKWIKELGFALEGGGTQDELDACACAISVWMFLCGKGRVLGGKGGIVVPSGKVFKPLGKK